MGEHHEHPEEPAHWVDMAMWPLLALGLAVTVADFAYDKHGHYYAEEFLGFHSVYGFVSCVLLVIAATQMRKVLMRSEDYYDE